MPTNIAQDGNRPSIHGNSCTTEPIRLPQRLEDRHKQQKGRKRTFVNRYWIRTTLLSVLALFSLIGSLIGLLQRKSSYHLQNAQSHTVKNSAPKAYETEPRTLRSFYVDRAVDHYPFTGLADTLSKRSRSDTAFYWHIPRSGGTTLKNIIGKCLHLTQASRTSTDYCDVESKDLHVCHTRLGDFVNADTSDNDGIQRALNMKLVNSGLADVIVSSRFLHAASLFDENHAGRAFTLIRDPLERAVSTFYYLKEAEWERQHKDVLNDMTLMEYIHRDDTSSDWMVRWLTGKQSEPVLNEKDLKLAKDILKKKFFILLTEEMATSVDRLVQYMGWEVKDESRACIHNNVARASRLNKSVHPDIEVGSKEYLALKSRNRYDFELYDYALKLFQEQWAVGNERDGGTVSIIKQEPSASSATAVKLD